MERFTAVLLTAAMTAAASPALHAQWPVHPRPGVPQGADGKVNLTAPAPRAPDGRPLPTQGEPQPYWHGYSVGRWDGDTFLVESNNFRGVQGGLASDGWLDQLGSPFTDALRLTERFRRPNFGNLEIDVTIDDPKAYTRPFTVRVEQVIVADGWEMVEFVCHENQQFLKMTGRQ